MSRGKFKISTELLREILKLPAGTDISGATMDEDRRCIELVVSHPQIVPGPEGETAQLNPKWSRHEPLQFDGWGQGGMILSTQQSSQATNGEAVCQWAWEALFALVDERIESPKIENRLSFLRDRFPRLVDGPVVLRDVVNAMKQLGGGE